MKRDYSYAIRLSEEEVRFLEKEMEREIAVIEDFKELESIAEKIKMLDDIRASCAGVVHTIDVKNYIKRNSATITTAEDS